MTKIYFDGDFKNAKRTEKTVILTCGKQKFKRAVFCAVGGFEFVKVDNKNYVIKDEYGVNLRPFPFDSIRIAQGVIYGKSIFRIT